MSERAPTGAGSRPTVLIIDDEQIIREALAETLEDAGYAPLIAAGVEAARGQLHQPIDAILLDIRLKDGDGLVFLSELKAADPGRPVIMATAYGDSERTIRAMSAGAFDYVTKPFDLDELLDTLARAVRRPSVVEAAPSAPAPTGFIGSSPAMLRVWKAIGRAASSAAPVLITGESGVGKELVAQAIHDYGAQASGAFVPVNLAALSPGLIESELFGHERGAFTHAHARREGRFALAAGGTLFLDEIGDLDLSLQTKLLRVLEDGGYERVGGSARLQASARIIAATSRPVTPGEPGATLREDLYYRLGVIRIEVPPLRDRRQDIPLLVDAFLRRSPTRRAISVDGMQRLMAYGWPGNVRQLLHVVESACVMSADEILDAESFTIPTSEPPALAQVAPDADGLCLEGLQRLEDLHLRTHLERLERGLIELALQRAEGNRAEAARLLGIRRALLYARMKHLDIEG